MRTLIILSITAVLAVLHQSARAQSPYYSIYPLETFEYEEMGMMLQNLQSNEISNEQKTLVLTTAIELEALQMRKWEDKYNKYLTKVDGYASSLNALAHVYTDGVQIFLNLTRIYTAIKNNPQGVIATMDLTNLYFETATEFITVYTLLKNAVSTGDKDNMLTGAERSKILWELNDKLAAFSKKLNALYKAIRYYKLADVWNEATTGVVNKTKATFASEARERWQRVAKTAWEYKDVDN